MKQAAKVSYKNYNNNNDHTEKTAGSIVLKCEALLLLPEHGPRVPPPPPKTKI